LHEWIRREGFRSEHAYTLPNPMLDQVHGDDGAESSLRDNRLTTPRLHTFFIVRNLIEIDFARLAVFRTFDIGSGASLAAHLIAEVSWIGQTSCDNIPRRDLHALDVDLFLVVQTKHMQGLKHANELIT